MASSAKQLALSEASVDGWEKGVEVTIYGYTLEKCGTYRVANDKVTMELVLVVKGTRYKFTESISGDQCFSAPLLGFKVEACVSQWSMEQGSVSFALTGYVVVADLKIKAYEEHVKLPMSSTEEATALEAVKASSPQELTHVLSLVNSVEGSDNSAAQSTVMGGCDCGGPAKSSAPAAEVPPVPPSTSATVPCRQSMGE